MDFNVIDKILNVIGDSKSSDYGPLWNFQGKNLSTRPDVTKATLPIFGSLPFCGGFLEDVDPLSMEINTSYLRLLLFEVAETRSKLIGQLTSKSQTNNSWDEVNRKSVSQNILTTYPQTYEYLVPFNSIGRIPHFLINDEASSKSIVSTLGSVKSAFILYNMIQNNVLEFSSNKPLKVLEIGAGYGSQCETLLKYSFKKNKSVQYIICDIPSSLLYSYYYISSTFPDINCVFIDSEEEYQEKIHQILDNNINCVLFITPELIHLLKGQHLTLAYNSESFLEMGKSYLNNYLTFIFHSLKVDSFCSRNRKWRYDENLDDENKRSHEEVKSAIPSDWQTTLFDENFLLDQPHVRDMGSNGQISSIENVFAIRN